MKRKERPTYMIFEDYYRGTDGAIMPLGNGGQENQMLSSLPRCVVSPPCGHCWYCRQHEATR